MSGWNGARSVDSAPCVKCGVRVFMLKVRGTNMAAAFDAHVPVSTDTYWTADQHGYAVMGGGFVEHGCDVDVVLQFNSTWLSDPEVHTAMNDLAYEVMCPRCGAGPGELCWNLYKRRTGEQAHTKAPHKERYPEDVLRSLE